MFDTLIGGDMAENLIEALLSEIDRVQEIIKVYTDIPGGRLAAYIMQAVINEGKRAMGSGDIIEMINVYDELKEYTL